uniref:JmjC domain-containing protein n=2 Tax=Caenorhabditis tropicalis TaxID=1561998 RepID=A0A1I7TRA7_9PELO
MKKRDKEEWSASWCQRCASAREERVHSPSLLSLSFVFRQEFIDSNMESTEGSSKPPGKHTENESCVLEDVSSIPLPPTPPPPPPPPPPPSQEPLSLSENKSIASPESLPSPPVQQMNTPSTQQAEASRQLADFNVTNKNASSTQGNEIMTQNIGCQFRAQYLALNQAVLAMQVNKPITQQAEASRQPTDSQEEEIASLKKLVSSLASELDAFKKAVLNKQNVEQSTQTPEEPSLSAEEAMEVDALTPIAAQPSSPTVKVPSQIASKPTSIIDAPSQIAVPPTASIVNVTSQIVSEPSNSIFNVPSPIAAPPTTSLIQPQFATLLNASIVNIPFQWTTPNVKASTSEYVLPRKAFVSIDEIGIRINYARETSIQKTSWTQTEEDHVDEAIPVKPSSFETVRATKSDQETQCEIIQPISPTQTEVAHVDEAIPVGPESSSLDTIKATKPDQETQYEITEPNTPTQTEVAKIDEAIPIEPQSLSLETVGATEPDQEIQYKLIQPSSPTQFELAHNDEAMPVGPESSSFETVEATKSDQETEYEDIESSSPTQSEVADVDEAIPVRPKPQIEEQIEYEQVQEREPVDLEPVAAEPVIPEPVEERVLRNGKQASNVERTVRTRHKKTNGEGAPIAKKQKKNKKKKKTTPLRKRYTNPKGTQRRRQDAARMKKQAVTDAAEEEMQVDEASDTEQEERAQIDAPMAAGPINLKQEDAPEEMQSVDADEAADDQATYPEALEDSEAFESSRFKLVKTEQAAEKNPVSYEADIPLENEAAQPEMENKNVQLERAMEEVHGPKEESVPVEPVHEVSAFDEDPDHQSPGTSTENSASPVYEETDEATQTPVAAQDSVKPAEPLSAETSEIVRRQPAKIEHQKVVTMDWKNEDKKKLLAVKHTHSLESSEGTSSSSSQDHSRELSREFSPEFGEDGDFDSYSPPPQKSSLEMPVESGPLEYLGNPEEEVPEDLEEAPAAKKARSRKPANEKAKTGAKKEGRKRKSESTRRAKPKKPRKAIDDDQINTRKLKKLTSKWAAVMMLIHARDNMSERLEEFSEEEKKRVDTFIRKYMDNQDTLNLQGEVTLDTMFPDEGNYRHLEEFLKKATLTVAKAPAPRKGAQVTPAPRFPNRIKLSGKGYVELNSTADEVLAKTADYLRNGRNEIWMEKGDVELPMPSPELIRAEKEMFAEARKGLIPKFNNRMACPIFNAKTMEEVNSPEFDRILNSSPIMLVNGMSKAIGLNEGLFDHKVIQNQKPNKRVDLLDQIPQSADWNYTADGIDGWRVSSFFSSMEFSEFREYIKRSQEDCLEAYGVVAKAESPKKQEKNLQKMMEGKIKNGYKPGGENADLFWIRFGTNIDLLQEDYLPQYEEIQAKFPACCRPSRPENLLNYVGADILGINTVQMYIKVPGVRTAAHMENSLMCSINWNRGPGSCTWFAVANEYWAKLVHLVNLNFMRFNGQDYWPSEVELHRYQIPYYKFEQKADSMVYVPTGTFHWVQSNGFCTHISWNVGQPTFTQLATAMVSYDFNLEYKFEQHVPMVSVAWKLAKDKMFVNDENMYKLIKSIMIRGLGFSKFFFDTLARDNQEIVEATGDERKLGEFSRCDGCRCEVFNIVRLYEDDSGEFDRSIAYCSKCTVPREVEEERTLRFIYYYSLDELKRIFDAYKPDQ